MFRGGAAFDRGVARCGRTPLTLRSGYRGVLPTGLSHGVGRAFLWCRSSCGHTASTSITKHLLTRSFCRYDSCDVGTFPNQTNKDKLGPPAALHSDFSRDKYDFELSWLSGQRLRCVRPPSHSFYTSSDISSPAPARALAPTTPAPGPTRDGVRPRLTYSRRRGTRITRMGMWCPRARSLRRSRMIICMGMRRRTSGRFLSRI
jgi:hypothetical protein